jgi:hypothetical protein
MNINQQKKLTKQYQPEDVFLINLTEQEASSLA